MATSKELASDSGTNTVVGHSILISGKLTGDEDLVVRGRVEGTEEDFPLSEWEDHIVNWPGQFPAKARGKGPK